MIRRCGTTDHATENNGSISHSPPSRETTARLIDKLEYVSATIARRRPMGDAFVSLTF